MTGLPVPESANDCNGQALQPVDRALAEDLRMRGDEAWRVHPAGICVPEMKIVASDRDAVDGFQF